MKLVVTRIYRPSDLEAVKKKEEIKKRLGVPSDPKKWSHNDMMKVDRYFRSIGWDMSMSGCNPSSFFWNKDPITNKALCMLYNELMIARAGESLRSAKRDLARFGSVYQRHYEEVKRKVQSRTAHLAKYNQVVKVEVEKNTGVKTVPRSQPKPSVVMKPVAKKVQSKPVLRSSSVPTTVHAMVEQQSQPEQKKTFPSWIIPAAVLAGLFIISRRR
ncbi:SAM pointed domain-containing ETS-like transcription factor [Thermococcus nautili]|uniref:hypothetical protein n=1 Tax=Thermococcus nautili TaxID=195522 RepID=UPI0025528CB7|nr:hypothetical protein [Thermococcus nautili]CAI1492059.1 SAM pointed domain-containing ETS-like transcription factor [Thermococcus nautili]